MNVDEAAARVAADGTQSLVDTAAWTNLASFFGRGGKILYYHGLSDPWFSPLDTLGYYQRLADANGGADAVRASSRIFLVPGMGHCQGAEGGGERVCGLERHRITTWLDNHMVRFRATGCQGGRTARSRRLPYGRHW